MTKWVSAQSRSGGRLMANRLRESLLPRYPHLHILTTTVRLSSASQKAGARNLKCDMFNWILYHCTDIIAHGNLVIGCSKSSRSPNDVVHGSKMALLTNAYKWMEINRRPWPIRRSAHGRHVSVVLHMMYYNTSEIDTTGQLQFNNDGSFISDYLCEGAERRRTSLTIDHIV